MFKKIYIEITNVCNLKCRFCPDTNRAKKMMSVKDFAKIIKKVCNYTNLICLHVKGEPLLHKDLDKILNVLEKYHLKANITTNGVLLKEKNDILKKSKAIRQINVSLHSITQNEMVYKTYLENVFTCCQNLDNVIISYRLWNLKNIQENSINKKIICMIEKYYHISNLQEKLAHNSYLKIKNNIFINQDIEFIWPNVNNKNINEKGRCLALKEQIAVLADGSVVPCCLDNNGDIVLGNIFKESLEDILNKEKSIVIKRNFANGIITCKLCKTCGFLQNLENKRK